MNHYIEIKVQPDAELSTPVLINILFAKLHKALCDLKATDIGISFPKANITLCDVLRLHSTEPQLNELMALSWIGGMSGYCQLSAIQAVPDNVKYRTISRKQTNMSHAKLKRLLKRGSISPEQVADYKAKMFGGGLDSPYIETVSHSTGHRYRRYIVFGELQDEAMAGQFDQFGLSKTATVPWF